jgi:hypothetical protein
MLGEGEIAIITGCTTKAALCGRDATTARAFHAIRLFAATAML